MIGWFRRQTPQVRWMVVLIAVLVVCVATRWAVVRKEAGEAVRQRIEHFKRP